MSTVYSFISDYNGNNSFLNSLKSGYTKYGRLTPSQVKAAEKIINGMKEKIKSMAPVEVKENIELIMSYEGKNKFVKDLQVKYKRYGRLTEKQIDAALKVVNRVVVNKVTEPKPIKGQSIQVRQYIARQIKEQKGLNFLPILIEVTHLIGASRKAVHLRGKLSTEVGAVCRCCGRALSDEFSILTGMGKTCAKNTGVQYIKNKDEVSRFNEDLKKRVDEIGHFDFWIPKSQVSKWEGIYRVVLDNSFTTYSSEES